MRPWPGMLGSLRHFGAALLHARVRHDSESESMTSFGPSDAGVRKLELEPDPTPPAPSRHLDELLDEALEHTFPASDPVAIWVDRDPVR